MRLLQLNNYADPVGGAEVYARALTRELRARGHVVGTFGTSEERAADSELEHVVRRPRYDPRVLTLDPAVRAGLETCIGRLRPELVHLHNVFSLGLDVVAYLVATGIPLVQTVHDANLICANSWCVWGDGTVCSGGIGTKCFQHDCQRNYPFDGEQAFHGLLAHRVLVDGVDVTLCGSRFLAGRMTEHGRRDVRHLPYFVEPIALPPATARAEQELVYFGRLTPEKGVDSMLDALALVRERAPGVHLTVASGGSVPRPLAARAGLLGSAVTMLGDVPRAELGRLHAAATACMLPSIWCENAPLTALECLASGLPMLASRIGGIPELVEEGVTGFTFRPRDARDMADTIVRFLALPSRERERMSVAMRARADAYRLDTHVARVEETYRELIGAPRARPAARTPLDGDFLAPLVEFGREKAHLAKLFTEHVAYIAQLERTAEELSARNPTAVGLVRRLARRLGLPRLRR